MSDRDDRGLLADVELDDPARAVVAEARDDHPVARLEACSGFGDGVGLPGLVLELGQASGERLAGPLGLGLGLEGRLPGFLGLLADLLEELPLRDRPAAVLREVGLGTGDHMLGELQVPGDLECVRLPDVADVQPVLGLEGLIVELDGGVLRAGVDNA